MEQILLCDTDGLRNTEQTATKVHWFLQNDPRF